MIFQFREFPTTPIVKRSQPRSLRSAHDLTAFGFSENQVITAGGGSRLFNQLKISLLLKVGQKIL